MQTGFRSANSIVFSGNINLTKTAIRGGSQLGGGGSIGGGSGHGGDWPYNGYAAGQANINVTPFETDLAYNASNISFPDNFKEYVYFAAGCDGGNVVYGAGGFGQLQNNYAYGPGGGAFGKGGAYDPDALSGYGHTINKGQNRDVKDAGHGISWSNNRNYPQSEIPIIDQDAFPHRWYENPLYDGTNSVSDMAGGHRGYNGVQAGADGVGSSGYGSGRNGNGHITISYPYRPAYRFITNQDLS